MLLDSALVWKQEDVHQSHTKLQTRQGSSWVSHYHSLLAQTVKRLPTIWETQVRSLGWKRSSGEGNGNPLQYSCLENPHRWRRLVVHGVAKSWTRLSDFTFIFSIILGLAGNAASLSGNWIDAVVFFICSLPCQCSILVSLWCRESCIWFWKVTDTLNQLGLLHLDCL